MGHGGLDTWSVSGRRTTQRRIESEVVRSVLDPEISIGVERGG